MSENERLREALETVRLRLMESQRRDRFLPDILTTVDAALGAEPKTCVWTFHYHSVHGKRHKCACDGRIRYRPVSLADTDIYEDNVCPGCGRKIEVKETTDD